MIPRGVCAVGLALLVVAHSIARPCAAQSDRPKDLLRGLVGGFAPGSAEDLETEAVAAEELDSARRLYETLHARYADSDPGKRAALWLGRYHYGTGAVEEALPYFEQVRSAADDPLVEAEAIFWCEQSRLLAGREPLQRADGGPAEDFWAFLWSMSRVDRSVRQGRIDEAQTRLVALQEEVCSLGLCGLLLVRWGDILRLQGREPIDIEELGPLIELSCRLPERLHLERPLVGVVEGQAPGESWSLEFGAHIDRQDAQNQQDELRTHGLETRIDEIDQADRTTYRVRLGDFSNRAEIDSFASQITLEAAARPRSVRLR